MSPYNSNYSQVYYSNSNPLHTPESSPTHSPDATHAATLTRNRKPNGTIIAGMARAKNTDDSVAVTSSLPTPEMSPLELEKENYNNSLSNNKQKMSFVDYNGHLKSDKAHGSGTGGGSAGGSVTPTSYAFSSTVNSSARNMSPFDVDAIERHVIKREYNSYSTANSCINTSVIDSKASMSGGVRSLYHNSIYDSGASAGSDKRSYTSATTSTFPSSMSLSTTIAAGKGMYVTCSSRGILDQGNVVRGTYFPPLATSQDHQNLGTVTSSQSISASTMSNMHYTSNHHHLDGAIHLNAVRSGNGGPGTGSGPSSLAKESNNIIGGEDSASHNGIPIDGYAVYETASVTTPMATYATTSPYNQQYKEYVHYNQTQSPNSNTGQQPMHGQHQAIGEEVDSREFEKYFKYPDSNHNFNEYDSNSPYHGHSNTIFHNHQIPHVISSPHHPAALIPQEYYHFYNPNAPNAPTGRYDFFLCSYYNLNVEIKVV